VRAGALCCVGREAEGGRVAGVELEGGTRLGVFGGRAGEDVSTVAADGRIGRERGREEAGPVEGLAAGVLYRFFG
jgi:hypothetical protein